MANRSTGIYGHFGSFSATNQLPNVAGAVVQSSEVQVGDLAAVSGVLYICTTATLGAAVWAAVSPASGTAAGNASPVVSGLNGLAYAEINSCGWQFTPATQQGAPAVGAGLLAIRGQAYPSGAGSCDFTATIDPAEMPYPIDDNVSQVTQVVQAGAGTNAWCFADGEFELEFNFVAVNTDPIVFETHVWFLTGTWG